ncbi:D-2-hydroxyacid dehydrogenase [Aerococcus christensenii]|uniref:D-2-hydroxyacid dehydrogenase n=1 Tax=Aerococcus christensenii TaxID=87541 RepID=UPI000763266B|nr:D-2-hydroxyacid dehydrogenase [Aerococcus christensenii]AMB92650.1 lactate dehydrogenase [Aerococcus christensenii]
MTKIYMYGVSEQERESAQRWGEENNIELFLDEDILMADTVDRCKGYDGVSTYQYTRLDDAVYPKLKEFGIKNIAQRMAGFDPYNLELAKENDVIISNVPAYSPESIAEYSVGQAINGIRNLYTINHHSLNHDFRESLFIRGSRVGGKTVAILGTGRIGQATARLFKGLGCKVIGYDLYPNDKLGDLLEYRDTPEDCVKEADIISLHMPATDDTYHMFDTDMFKLCKKGAILINAGRGVLVDTEALLDALDEGHLSFAALDTYEHEFEYVKHDYQTKAITDQTFLRLLHHPLVSYTPHIAYYTDEAVQNMVFHALNATKSVIETGDTKLRVN